MPKKMRNEWPSDREAAMIRLWHEGNSASQVARKLEEMFGIKFTRNAIIGKVHRLIDAGKMLARGDAYSKPRDESKRGSNYKRQKKLVTPDPAKSNLADIPIVPPETRVPSPKPILPATVRPEIYGENVIVFPGRHAADTGPTTLEHVRGCLYAIGINHKNQHVFCNSEKQEGSAYCTEHHKKCHVPTKPIDMSRKAKKWRPF